MRHLNGGIEHQAAAGFMQAHAEFDVFNGRLVIGFGESTQFFEASSAHASASGPEGGDFSGRTMVYVRMEQISKGSYYASDFGMQIVGSHQRIQREIAPESLRNALQGIAVHGDIHIEEDQHVADGGARGGVSGN